MREIDPVAVIGALREVGETIILPRYNKLQDHEVRTKTNAQDVVTVADEESEHRLAVTLPALLPGSKLIGEESVAKKPALLEELAGEDWVWVVDPVDGTLNFVHGRPVFCTMAALMRRGETAWGFIHDPLSNRTLYAQRGAGAFMAEGGALQRRHVLQPESADLSRLAIALYDKDLAPLKGKFARVSRSGCAGHDYWSMVEGRLDVASFRRLMPWDHAPGVLIHAEAGGYHRMLSGAAYQPGQPGQMGILSTPNSEIWDRIIAVRQTFLS